MVRYSFHWSARAEIGGAARDVFGNLAGHQVSMLIAALVRLAFDVEIDPAGGGITVGGAERLHGLARGPGVARADFVETDAFEPRGPVGNAPPLPTVSRISSCERLAMNFSERRVHGCVPPSEAEWTSNGMDAMESVAPVAMGERSRSRMRRLSVRTQPESS